MTKLPLEFWLGLVTLAGGAILKDNSLLIMSAVFLGTSRILLEMRK